MAKGIFSGCQCQWRGIHQTRRVGSRNQITFGQRRVRVESQEIYILYTKYFKKKVAEKEIK